MKTLRLLSLFLLVVAAGCSSDDGYSMEFSGTSGVFPEDAFLGKTVELVVYGSDEWGPGTTVSFGDGVTVGETVLAGPNTILATVTVDVAAATGPRDVVVNGKALEGKFDISSPLAVTVRGTQAQGSVLVLDVENLDTERPFDTTTTGDGFFNPLEYVNFGADLGGAGTNVFVDSVSAFNATLLATVDVNAEVGPRNLTVVSGATAKEAYPAPAIAELVERSAAELTPTTNGSQTEAGASALYRVTAGSLKLYDMSLAASSSENAAPALLLLGASGSFEEMLGQDVNHYFTAEQDVYVIFFDGSPEAGYDYQINLATMTPTIAKEVEPNDFISAIAMTLPFHSADANFASADDEDWYTFTVDEAGSVFRGMTEGGDFAADPKMFLYAEGDNETAIAESDDSNYHELFFSEPLDAGTYWVKIQWSPEYADAYDGTATNYKASFWLD